MKKILTAIIVALAAVLAAEQQASAWSKCNFSVGLNFSSEGGGNSWLGGMFKGGPTPGSYDGYMPGGVVGPSYPAPQYDAPKPLPTTPEKVGDPAPVKPSMYNPGQYQPVGYYYPYQPAAYYPSYPYYTTYPYYYGR